MSTQPCRSARFRCVLRQCSLRAEPVLCHVDLSCCPPWFEQCVCRCKDSGSSFPILLNGRKDQPPYTGNAGVNAVVFLCFLSLCVHITVSSARTNSLLRSQTLASAGTP